ncbi:MAG: nucleoside hydrolase [Pseudomonadota bacterium]
MIDCDPGLDDAVALLAALGSPQLDVVAITTVAGNVKGAQTALNARIIRELAGLGPEVPVTAGAPRPLRREPVTAEDFHGTTGLGGLDLPKPRTPLSRQHGVNTIINAARRAARARTPLTLVCTGPLTNVALALTMAPDLAGGVSELIMMAGADREGGNIKPWAEFNVFADPHAADIVFNSGLAIRCLSLDVTHQLRTTPARLAMLRQGRHPRTQAAADFLEASCKLEFSANGAREAPLHDPSTTMALLMPEAFNGQRVHVAVGTVDADGMNFGQTKVSAHTEGPVLWYDRVDADAVFDGLYRALEGQA